MEKPKQEILSNREQNLEKLKNSLFELINQYNNDPSHREVEPINNFGEPYGKLRLYWANWHDDNHSTHMIGFMFNGVDGVLRLVGGKETFSLNEATDCFMGQLKDIPKK